MGFMLYAIAFASIAFSQGVRGHLPVDCSNGKYQDQIFLKSSYGIYVCQDDLLVQKACFSDTVANGQCIDIDKAVRTVPNLKRLYYRRETGYDCDGIINNRFMVSDLISKGIFQDCAQYFDYSRKYDLLDGNVLCNINKKQVYNFQDGGWEKCDENGLFNLQSCVGNQAGPPQCASKTDLDEIINQIPPEAEIHTEDVPYCIKLGYRTEQLNFIWPACIFDSPKIIYRPVPVEPETFKPTPAPASPPPRSPPPQPPVEETTKEIVTRKPPPLELSTKKTYVTPSRSPTTEEPEETTEATPQCLNGLKYNVWYDNEMPTHCELFKENGDQFYAEFESLYSIFSKRQQPPWDNPKMNILYWRFAYTGKLAKRYVHNWDLLSKNIRQLLMEFATNEETKISTNIPIGPRSFCDFFQNFLPIKMDFIFDETIDRRSYSEDCVPKDYDEAVDFPIAKHNIWLSNEKFLPKCYINYVPGNKKCITLKRAENILSQFNTRTDAKDENKILAAATRLILFHGEHIPWPRPDARYRFDTMMNSGVHIMEIIKEYNEMLTYDVDQSEEHAYPFMIDSREEYIMGISNFCTIFSELVPLHFNQRFVNFNFHDCDEIVDENDFSEVED